MSRVQTIIGTRNAFALADCLAAAVARDDTEDARVGWVAIAAAILALLPQPK